MRRLALIAVSLLALAGCQSTTEAPATAPQANAQRQEPRGVTITPAGFRLPEGGGCQGDIARFRAIQANDLDTGHVTRSVYDQIEVEMKRADSMCAAGQGGAASAHVRATRSRFGYP